MPHHYASPCGDGFVTLAQLNSPPAILDDYDMIDQNNIDMTVDMDFSQFPDLGGKFDINPDYAFKQAANNPFRSGTWPLRHLSTTSDTSPNLGEFNSPSPSNSPSPPGTVQHEQHQKRRAQNRQA